MNNELQNNTAMKHLGYTFLLLILGIALLLPSCNLIQLSRVDSSNVKLHEDGIYKYEDDTVAIRYDFWPASGARNPKGKRVDAFVYNKTNRPLFVQWDKSYYVFDRVAYPFWRDVYQVTSSSSDIGYIYKNFTIGSGETNTTLSRKARIMTVAPKSELFLLKLTGNVLGGNSGYIKTGVTIAYSLGSESDSIAFITNEFWISKTEKIPYTIHELSIRIPNAEKQRHLYYIQGNAWAWYGGSMGLVGVVVVIGLIIDGEIRLK